MHKHQFAFASALSACSPVFGGMVEFSAPQLRDTREQAGSGRVSNHLSLRRWNR
jgi:hypothetical protein